MSCKAWRMSVSGPTRKSRRVAAKSALHHITDISSPGANTNTANSAAHSFRPPDYTHFTPARLRSIGALNGCTFVFD